MKYIEVTGWNIENESVEDSCDTHEGESEDDAIARMCARSGIIEVGDVHVYERRCQNR